MVKDIVPDKTASPYFILVDAHDRLHVWFEHTCLEGDRFKGYLPSNTWSIVENHPLSVTPSVHCTVCNLHGFIIAGQWVPV